MLVVTLNSMIFWTLIAGLLGPYTFVAAGLNYMIVHSVLKVTASSVARKIFGKDSLETTKNGQSFNFKATSLLK